MIDGRAERICTFLSRSLAGCFQTKQTNHGKGDFPYPSANDMACVICLDDEPAPIQSGCCCRGEQGLAHVACRARAAEHADLPTAWWICRTCKQPFTGVMRTSLAQERWARVKDLPEADGSRLAAAHNLAQSLLALEEYKQAEILLRQLLDVLQRFFDEDHYDTLVTKGNLAAALSQQGESVEAVALLQEVFVAKKRVLGEDDPSTLNTADNLAQSLSARGDHAEAEVIERMVLAAKGRVLGKNDPSTLITHANLAECLRKQHKLDEAEIVFKEVLVTMRRVLGEAHPSVLTVAHNLAVCEHALKSATR
jgi:tetratricopeptide (TPR) repeat protein